MSTPLTPKSSPSLNRFQCVDPSLGRTRSCNLTRENCNAVRGPSDWVPGGTDYRLSLFVGPLRSTTVVIVPSRSPTPPGFSVSLFPP